MTVPYTKEQLLKVAERVNYNYSEVARQLNISYHTVKSKLGPSKNYRGQIEISLTDQIKERDLHKELRDLKLQLEDKNNFIKLFQSVENFEPPKWLDQKSDDDDTSEVPVLFTSDFQWGEVVKEKEIDGINEYNQQIATQRYQRLIDKTISLYPKKGTGLILLRGGDSISGEIHDELSRTNDQQIVPAIVNLAEVEIEGIRRLKQHFGRIMVISVPGNHGRSTIKPIAKGYVTTNYDTLVTMFITQRFAKDEWISFYTPVSGDAYFTVFGYKFLLTHGDRIGGKGGQGFIGPIAPISKGVVKTRQQYLQMGRPIDYVLLGHYHTPFILPNAIANGTLVGFNEYAKGLRIEPQPPSQWFFTVNSRYGVNLTRLIYVDKLKRNEDSKNFCSWNPQDSV